MLIKNIQFVFINSFSYIDQSINLEYTSEYKCFSFQNGALYNNNDIGKKTKKTKREEKKVNNAVSHYSPHKIARFCFSHDAMNRPSGCQATAVTIVLKEKEQNIQKTSLKIVTQIIKDKYLSFFAY